VKAVAKHSTPALLTELSKIMDSGEKAVIKEIKDDLKI
jgi:hypothetical protein